MEPNTTNPEEIPKKRPTCRPCGRHLLRAAGAVLVIGLVFRLLWNWVGGPLFTFPPLTFLQAVSAVATAGFLMLLCGWTSRRHRRHAPPHMAFACCPEKPSGPDKDEIRDILFKAMVK